MKTSHESSFTNKEKKLYEYGSKVKQSKTTKVSPEGLFENNITQTGFVLFLFILLLFKYFYIMQAK